MHERFKMVIFFLFLSYFLFSQDDQKSIAFFIDQGKIEKEYEIMVERLFDKIEEYIFDKNENFIRVIVTEKVDVSSLKQLSNYSFTNKIDVFYRITYGYESSSPGLIIINIKLLTPFQEILYDYSTVVKKEELKDLMKQDQILKWYNVFDKSVDKIKAIKRVINKTSLVKPKVNFTHDFPIVNISLSAISLKLYFDGRTSLKLFSFFPLEIRLTFYPLKYFEAGSFIKFDYNNMIYKYTDSFGNTKFFDSIFNFTYGLYAGFSYFNNNFHYSMGLQFYNLYYDLNKTKFIKTNDINSYFLPQFSFYNKIDIKIFKFLNYTIFINLKTMPLFENSGNFFYSRPFYYDFVTLEFSLVGFSLTF